MGKEGEPKPGKSETNEANYSTFKICGDTKRTSQSKPLEDDDDVVIVVVENLDTEGDGASSVVVYKQDLPE